MKSLEEIFAEDVDYLAGQLRDERALTETLTSVLLLIALATVIGMAILLAIAW